MDHESHRSRIQIGGVLIGLGLGGFFDGIVLHQLLQWHHMVSHVSSYPTTTVAGLKANTLGDGLFHAGTWICTVAGLFVLWSGIRHKHVTWSTEGFVGLLLLGWGLFNLVEGIIDHQILQLHHVKEVTNHRLAWDLAFLAWGTAMVVIGVLLNRQRQEELVS